MHAAISQINFQLTLEKEQSLTNKCHYQFTLDKIKMTLDWKERFVQLTLDCNRWQFSCLYIFALLKTWHWCPLYINIMRHRRSMIITIRHSRAITRRHRVKKWKGDVSIQKSPGVKEESYPTTCKRNSGMHNDPYITISCEKIKIKSCCASLVCLCFFNISFIDKAFRFTAGA